MRKWAAPYDGCRHAWVGCIVNDSNLDSALTCKEMCDNSGENGLSGQNRELDQRLCSARRTSTTRNLGRWIPRAPGGASRLRRVHGTQPTDAGAAGPNLSRTVSHKTVRTSRFDSPPAPTGRVPPASQQCAHPQNRRPMQASVEGRYLR
jgi:hypothetical protein